MKELRLLYCFEPIFTVSCPEQGETATLATMLGLLPERGSGLTPEYEGR